MLLSINAQNPQMRLIKKAVEILGSGGLVIYPTDTVYGLGCDLHNKKGIDRIYEIKRTKKKQPLSFICANLKEISRYAAVSDFAYKTMKRCLPGPYTFILDASRLVPKTILPKRLTTGIRVPDNLICLTLTSEFGRPIISTSVEMEGEDFPGDPREMEKRYGHCVDLVIDGGIIPPGQSTVISLIDDQVEIIREGQGDISYFV
ncbi:MAG: L-threonylcarbamoyladenylate synthase [Smithellaceae bacterium]|nr:L-threonylcarbamoyladenylate synthase [Smithellaceae bacterium]